MSAWFLDSELSTCFVWHIKRYRATLRIEKRVIEIELEHQCMYS